MVSNEYGKLFEIQHFDCHIMIKKNFVRLNKERKILERHISYMHIKQNAHWTQKKDFFADTLQNHIKQKIWLMIFAEQTLQSFFDKCTRNIMTKVRNNSYQIM